MSQHSTRYSQPHPAAVSLLQLDSGDREKRCPSPECPTRESIRSSRLKHRMTQSACFWTVAANMSRLFARLCGARLFLLRHVDFGWRALSDSRNRCLPICRGIRYQSQVNPLSRRRVVIVSRTVSWIARHFAPEKTRKTLRPLPLSRP